MSANIAGSYKINGTPVLTSSSLGSGITSSALTSLGTLSSLTVTGDVAIDSTTLKVDSTNNRVGIVKASPAYPLDVVGDVNTSTNYKIGGTDVLTSTTLGSTVVNSSLTSIGALSSLTVNGPITVSNGSAPTSGQVGYRVSSVLGSNSNFYNTIQNLLSISLSAGTWLVVGTLGTNSNDAIAVGIQTANNTLSNAFSTNNVFAGTGATAGSTNSVQVTHVFYLASTTTLYLNVLSTIAGTSARIDKTAIIATKLC